MNQYESGKIRLYSGNSGDDPSPSRRYFSEYIRSSYGATTYDENNGFHRQITAVLRDASGSYQQQYITEFPDIYDGNGKLLFRARMLNSSLLMMSLLTDNIIDPIL